MPTFSLRNFKFITALKEIKTRYDKLTTRKCWKYKLLIRFCKPYHTPICCVGCKYAKNNKCTRTPKERGGEK